MFLIVVSQNPEPFASVILTLNEVKGKNLKSPPQDNIPHF
jgi:hypothetical protein